MRTALATGAVVAVLLSGLVGIAVGEDSTKPVILGDLGGRLDQAVRTSGGADFWGSVLVARGEEILLANGYEFADYQQLPNTPATLFELASASKQVAATAILHLCQKKKLKLDDTLGDIFKAVPEDKKAITVHQLLTHTSGISGRIGVPYASRLTRREYVPQMLAKPLSTEPGTKFEYCNVGYALLAAIVEEVSHKSFEDYVSRNLFKPAKLVDTGFIGDPKLIRSERVSARKGGGLPDATAANWHWGWGYRGMGGVVTTVLDLLRWDRAMRGDRILNEEYRKILYTPQREGYACGWKVETTIRGTRKAHHSGGVAGYGINLVRYLEEDVAIFVLSNDGRAAHSVTAALERLLFPPPRLAATIDLESYVVPKSRILALPETVKFQARAVDGKLFFCVRDGRVRPLEVSAPIGYAGKLIDSLKLAIAAREADDDLAPAKVEAGFYLQPYDHSATILELDEALSLEIRPEYRGRGEGGEEVVDKRILLILEDRRYGWPFMAKLNVTAGKELLAELESAMSGDEERR